jgi:hypothetical protein
MGNMEGVTMTDYMVTRSYDADGGAPTTRQVPRNFVATYAQPDTALVQRVADAALQPSSPTETLAQGIASQRALSETSTPVARAQGIVMTGTFVVAFALVASYGLRVVGASGGQVFLFFVTLSIVGVAMVFRLDYSHSPTGTERHKVNRFAETEMHRIDASKEVDLAKVAAFSEMVRVVYGHKDNES